MAKSQKTADNKSGKEHKSKRTLKKEQKAKLRAYLMVGIMVVVALVAAASCFV